VWCVCVCDVCVCVSVCVCLCVWCVSNRNIYNRHLRTLVLRAEHGTWYLPNINLLVTNTASRDILPQR